MKKIPLFKYIIAGLAVLLVSSGVVMSKPSQNYKKGVNYDVINAPKTEEKVLTEVFSYYCPACYSLESVMPEVKGSLPKGMKLERSHVNFLGSASQNSQNFLTRYLALAKYLGVQERFSLMLFESIHQFSSIPSNHEQIMPIFNELGISEEDVLSNVLSEDVTLEYQKMIEYQEGLVEKEALKGVPTLIVNGKFKINTANLDRSDPIKDLNSLIEFLSELD